MLSHLAERLFEPFVTGRAEGTGLGLAIVRELADAYGGRLELRRAGGDTAAGNRAQAAAHLGIRRQLLYQKLARYELDLSQNGTEGVPEADADLRDRASNASESQ